MNTSATRTNTQPSELLSHSLVTRTANRFGVDAGKFISTLKATCFKVKDGEATNEQMLALLVVAEQYKLNPFTRELFAFPDKQNGIVPVVSVDGWTRIINENPMLDGIKFVYADEMKKMDDDSQECPVWCEVHISRKDRSEPIIVREYLDEVYRPAFKKDGRTFKGPWQTHTKRFMRHKTLIQGSRIAFGFAGIYDQDEAERILETQVIEGEVVKGKPTVAMPQSKSKAEPAETAAPETTEQAVPDPEFVAALEGEPAKTREAGEN